MEKEPDLDKWTYCQRLAYLVVREDVMQLT
jgi:hypothetical protein